jgi:PAS domain S-box-containing protein
MLGVRIDINDRKQAEETIIEERTLLRTLINNLPNGVFVKDNEYRKIIVNPLHQNEVRDHLKVLGLNADIDILGKTDREVFSEELAAKYLIDDQLVVKDGLSLLNVVGIGYDQDGNQIWLLVSKIPLRDNKGEITGMLGVTTDITDRKRAEEEIQRQLDELRRWYEVTLDREGRVLQLKKEVNELLKQSGKPSRYASAIKDNPEIE